jgi:tetratricopeptide (TPR) repeat protein
MRTTRTIETFLEGKLEGTKLEEFRQLLNEDTLLAEEVRLHKEVDKSIADDDLQQFRNLVSTLFNKRKTSASKYIRILSAVAAAAAVVTIVILFSTRHATNDSLFASFYSPYQADFNTRSASIKNNGFELGCLLYQKGDYAKALDIFTKNRNTFTHNSAANFYFGLTALETGKLDVTEKSFLQVIEDNNSPFTLHAKWYLSLLYLKTGERNKAMQILKELDSTENYYTLKARQILEKMTE